VGSAPRAYHSDLRAAQAAQTRRRVLQAAAAVFARRGFQAATFATIAAEAGVSVETVKAAGTKPALLIAAFELVFSGTEGADSLTDTEAGADVTALDDAGFLPVVIERIVDANARAHALWTVLLGAAGSDELVAEALQGMLAHRRADYRRLVGELAGRGLIPAPRQTRSADELADELSFLMSPEGYQQLVVQSGWSPGRYSDWLVERVLERARGGTVSE